ncbi:HAMP domain-containing sensor histidine kinase [uncultured Ruminococcus sp.]|uniref:sensor histidine kinase n=1 Tax=uncultured Ruminococcus sp. TaxID=165186 RepID=UPI00292F7EA5|nr:HAMP domain-containing sensor histidine kinase [uncultured Ruminococcus sp.]
MKKLRKKIILGVIASVTAVFALTVLLIYLSMMWSAAQRADSLTALIADHNGKLPAFSEFINSEQNEKLRLYRYNEESPYRLRYFTVFYDENNEISKVDIEHIAAVNENAAAQLAETVREYDKSVGYHDDYRFRCSDSGKAVIMLDNSDDLADVGMVTLIITLISVFFIIMITIVFYFLSRIIVKPFEENQRMQKQFITDASHELKTPLAIISANAEVLAYKTGENEWIDNITTQVDRVSGLVNELLTLNRLEEVEEISGIEALDLSELIKHTCESFTEVFRNKKVTLTKDLESNLMYNGNPSQLERLISVLIENASKYASDNGEVKIILNKDLRYTYLTVFNTCEIDPKTDYTHLFDRFYRPDASRTSATGGHGIGLSIAKRIVILHGGTIEAVPSENGLFFYIKLSNKLKIK